MNREELIRKRGKAWKRLTSLLNPLAKEDGRSRLGGLSPPEIRELSDLYRSLAADLMRVRRDKLGADLERHLDGLASRAHNLIYAKGRVGPSFRLFDLVLDFPGAVRRNVRFFILATVLFYLPYLIAGVASYIDESYALAVLSSEQLERMEQMYRSASPDARNINTDSVMTGFYVWNNVSIALRCFATGLFFGIGFMFYLLYNGLFMGVVEGHLFRAGLGEEILSFVSIHQPWELTAIVISGAAGIQMGFALVRTHGRTRLGNLQAQGLEVLRQIIGAGLFLLLAALLEGNVSPSALPNETKYIVGIVGWVLVFVILFGVGRGRRVPRDVAQLRGGMRGA